MFIRPICQSVITKSKQVYMIAFILCVMLLSGCSESDEKFQANFLSECLNADLSSDRPTVCECTLNQMIKSEPIHSLKKIQNTPDFLKLKDDALVYCDVKAVFEATCKSQSSDLLPNVASSFCSCSYEELIVFFEPTQLNQMHLGQIAIADNFVEIYSNVAQSCLSNALNNL